jgi:integrase
MVGTDGLVRTSRRSEATEVAIANAAELWAKATTNVDTRRSDDCQRIKKKAVEDFFRSTGLDPTEVTPIEVDAWRAGLERRGLKPSTVYARVSYLSSFFSWLRTHVGPLGTIAVNPCSAARPRAPRAFQTKAVRALDDKELRQLADVVRLQAATGGPAERRDYALLLLLVTTGMRRAEALELDGRDLACQEEGIVVTAKVKGGNYVARLVASAEFRSALIDYLSSCGRTSVLKRGGPLWVRHDNAAKASGDARPISAWAFAARMKALAYEAGIPDFHLHQTRHTFARIVAESSGSFLETQDALGHRNPATTRAYVARIAVKRDKFGSDIERVLRTI